MAAYVMVDNEVTDPTQFAQFTSGIVRVVEAHNGRYLVRGGATEVVEGSYTPHRVVVIEFESVEQARAFVSSPEYLELAEIRSKSSVTSTIIVEGV